MTKINDKATQARKKLIRGENLIYVEIPDKIHQKASYYNKNILTWDL